MNLSEEDFGQLGMTSKEIAQVVESQSAFQPIIQAYKENGNMVRAKRKIRGELNEYFTQKANEMGLIEDEEGESIIRKLKELLTDELVASILIDEQQDVASVASATVYDKLLESLFRNITYDGKKIDYEVVTTQRMKPGLLSTTGRSNIRSSTLTERRNRLMGGEDRDNLVALFEMNNVLENFKIIKDGVRQLENVKSSVPREGINAAVAIREPVLSLMGSTSKKIIRRKESIYKQWKEVHGKFEDLQKAHKALIEKIKGIDASAEKEFIRNTKGMFTNKEKSSYTVTFKPAEVPDKPKQQIAFDLILTFVKKYGKNVEDSDAGADVTARGVEQESTEEKEPIATTSEVEQTETFYNRTAVDPITRFYLTKMLGGVFVPQVSKSEIQKLMREYIKLLPSLDEEDFTILERFFDDIPDIKPITTEVILPIHFAESLESRNLVKESVSVGEINELYRDYLESLGKLVEKGKYRMGSKGAITTLIGEEGKGKVDPEAFQFKPTYGYRSPPKQMQFRDVAYQRELNDVIEALNEYLFKPIQNPLLSLGAPFQEIRRLKEFKILSVYSAQKMGTESMSTQAVSALYDRFQKRPRSAMFTSKQLRILKDFLVGLRRNFNYEQTKKQLLSVRSNVLRPIFRKAGSDFLARTDRALGMWLVSLHRKLFSKGEEEFLGVKTKDLFGSISKPKGEPRESPRADTERQEVLSNYLDDVLELDAFIELKDFIETNKELISTKTSKGLLTQVINEFSYLQKSRKLENKILDAHDSFRILKGFPIYYGRGSLDCIHDISFMIDKIQEDMGLHVVATDIVKMVEEVDSFANIATEVGLSEEVVYFTKAHFR